ncbi:MAG: phosphatidylserine decarboxylase [Gammaproteobacteria bacterium]|nr:phosphatidylserine decarboxylase [Gammaproteobacteria bacterium]
MDQQSSGFSDRLKSWPLYFLPHHLISRLVFRLTRLETSLKNPVIRWFIKTYRVDMNDAVESDISRFASFNAFFTRALKADARPLCSGAETTASPVDGTVSQAGEIKDGRIFQAKGRDFSLLELLGGNAALAKPFENGRFSTLYLSPRDYHRIHMPVSGTLHAQTYVPGRLFSVAPHTVRTVPRLFARNERVIAFFDTPFGPMAMVLVGAINVAAIETVWSGLVTPPPGKTINEIRYDSDDAPSLEKGAEMGRFNMGSTVILLFGDNVTWLDDLQAGRKVRMGECIGSGRNVNGAGY